MPHADADRRAFVYRRHEPEKTLLYQVLAREWETWREERDGDAALSPLPAYVTTEIEAFFRCGILDHGFIVASCEGCDERLPVAFSCKRRGFCPSCAAKRSAEVAAHLVDDVLPHAPYRQWVTTFPYALRYWLAASRKLTGVVHRRVAQMVQLYYTHKAEERGIRAPMAGGVTFVQRFGSALNLNVHFHTVALDGVFSVARGEPVFHQLPGPTDEEVAGIVEAVAHVVIKELRRRGYLPVEDGDDTEGPPDGEVDPAFSSSGQMVAATAASATLRIAFGERAGERVRRVGRSFGHEDETPLAKGRRCFSVNGFTIHADRHIAPRDRHGLEKLLIYGARGAFAHERLSLADPLAPRGDLVYRLKTPWSDGTEAILLSPAELIEKLVALVPPPYVHMSRYFGVLASHSKWRRRVVLKPDVKRGFVALGDGTVVRMSWARLLARVFAVDVERCQACKRPLPAGAFELVTEPSLVHGILWALGLAGRAPARAPPRGRMEEADIDQSPLDYE
jgi:hypothetical protein